MKLTKEQKQDLEQAIFNFAWELNPCYPDKKDDMGNSSIDELMKKIEKIVDTE